MRIAKAAVTIDAGKDGIHAENNEDTSLGFIYISGGALKLESEGDGISAGATMQIEGGSFDILTGGGSENGAKQNSDSWGGFMGGRGPGQFQQSSSSAEDSTSIKGLKAGGSILIGDRNFTVNSADDALHANTSITVNGGTFTLSTGDDGIHADDTLTITAGKIEITESYEGLEPLHVAVSGGDIKLSATDDGINAAGGTDSSGTGGRGGDMFGNRGPGGMGGGPGGGTSGSSDGSIVLSGGSISIKAYGDGIDANGSLTVSGGHITVCGPTQGDTATLDDDTTGIIAGGTFIGTGASSGMAQSFSGAEQGLLALSVGEQAAGTAITIRDKDGKTLLSYTPELSFAAVIFSSPRLISGKTYTVTVGTSAEEFEAQ